MGNLTAGGSRFICLEGMDFSGKTSVALLLEKHFQEQGYEVLRTREPGGCDIAEQIRRIVIGTVEIKPIPELLLIMAGRYEHLHKQVLPALAEGKIVICDRFVGSGYIYQGIGKGLFNEVTQVFDLLRTPIIDQMFSQHLQTFVLDLSYLASRERMLLRGDLPNRLDVTDYNEFNRCRNAYKDLPKANDIFKHRFHIIDAEVSVNNVVQQILNKLGESHESFTG
jgi:dTMP kinase